ncbi:Serine carboxypeptidase-like 18 [Platanthera guangdongensis]|uniref:Serine carboxypeptidase-like 18 n=1 Tax=Platanthera guangdongensis TaxID=2320717 RepID=A0ABR2M5E1_9ASPA
MLQPPSFLLLLIVFSSTTTTLLWLCILSSASTITHLPGFNGGGALPFHLETGYVSVDDEVSKADLFYYFVESERNPREDPLILWLTGGPGCSSFYGLVREIGPLRFKVAPYNETLPTLVYNPYAWTKVSNIIFLDWPAVTGFSFLKSSKDYYNGDDFKSSKEICDFLEQWFLDHPKFKSNPFYVGGNSYGGKMVPIVALKIAEGIEAAQHPVINLKGYISGNPATGALIDGNSRVSYSHGMGILSDELFEAIQRSCPGEDYKRPKTGPCIEQIELFRGALNELMLDNFLTPKCEGESSWPVLSYPEEPHRSILERKSTELQTPPHVPDITCTTYASYLAYHWANSKDTRKALHVKETKFDSREADEKNKRRPRHCYSIFGDTGMDKILELVNPGTMAILAC